MMNYVSKTVHAKQQRKVLEPRCPMQQSHVATEKELHTQAQ